jgi:hypothetical protein
LLAASEHLTCRQFLDEFGFLMVCLLQLLRWKWLFSRAKDEP